MRERGELAQAEPTQGLLTSLLELRERLMVFVVLVSAIGVLSLLVYQRLQLAARHEAAARLYAACGVQAERLDHWFTARAGLSKELAPLAQRLGEAPEREWKQALRQFAEHRGLLDPQLASDSGGDASWRSAKGTAFWVFSWQETSRYVLEHQGRLWQLEFDAMSELRHLLAANPSAIRSFDSSVHRSTSEHIESVFAEGFRAIPSAAASQAQTRAFAGERGIISADDETGKRLYALRDTSQAGTIIMCSMEYTEAEAPLYRSLGLLLAAALCAALATLLALLLSRRKRVAPRESAETPPSVHSEEALQRAILERPGLVCALLEQSGNAFTVLYHNPAFAEALQLEADMFGEELDESTLPLPLLTALREHCREVEGMDGEESCKPEGLRAGCEQQLGGTGQAPNQHDGGRTGQALNQHEVGRTGQAPNQQKAEPGRLLQPWAQLDARFERWRGARLAPCKSPSPKRPRWSLSVDALAQNGISSPTLASEPPPTENSSS
jgi:hypothetical protein